MSPHPPLQRLKPVVRGGRIFGHGQIIAEHRQREHRAWKAAFYANLPIATAPTRQHLRREARLAEKRAMARAKAAAIHTLAGAIVAWTELGDPEDAVDRATAQAVVALIEPLVSPAAPPAADEPPHAIH